MKVITLIFLLILLLLQYPLWFSSGGWIKAWELEQRISELAWENQQIQQRNNLMDADVRDLQQGYEAIEERARNELGMTHKDEVFFRVVE